MDLAAQLRLLEAAQGDPAKLALASVDLAYPALSEPERAALKEALEAAAIPHWCDEAILAALLEVPHEESSSRLARLRGLRVVETFPARGEGAINVHEASRLALRKRMAAEEGARFRALSGRAAALFEPDATPAGRIEWIYHLLCAEPERGADDLERLGREWSSTAYPENECALAGALWELEEQELVRGRALLWAILVRAEIRAGRGEEAQLEGLAHRALELSTTHADPSAEAEALLLLGHVLEATGQLHAAQAALGKCLAVRSILVGEDPANAGWLRELAVAHSRVGDVLQAQGKLADAQSAFSEDLSISRRLVEQDPTNAGWQRDLLVAHSRVGEVLQAQGRLAEALTVFSECLSISRRLVEADPTNAGWQRDLAVSHSRVGGVLRAQGRLVEAQAAFLAYLAGCRWLAAQDPTNAGLLRELAVAHGHVGVVLRVQGNLREAAAAVGESLAIWLRLVEQDPANAGWLQDLAVAHSRVGEVLQAQGQLAEAQSAFEEYLSISRRLVEQDPTNSSWQRELAAAALWLGQLALSRSKPAEALPYFEEALETYRGLVQAAPDYSEWAKECESATVGLEACRALLEELSGSPSSGP